MLERLAPAAYHALYQTLLLEHEGGHASEAELLRRLLATPALDVPVARQLAAILDGLDVPPGRGRRDVNATLVRVSRGVVGPMTELDLAVSILAGDGPVPAALRAAGHDPIEFVDALQPRSPG